MVAVLIVLPLRLLPGLLSIVPVLRLVGVIPLPRLPLLLSLVAVDVDVVVVVVVVFFLVLLRLLGLLFLILGDATGLLLSLHHFLILVLNLSQFRLASSFLREIRVFGQQQQQHQHQHQHHCCSNSSPNSLSEQHGYSSTFYSRRHPFKYCVAPTT